MAGEIHSNFVIKIWQTGKEIKYTPPFFTEYSTIYANQVDQYYLPIIRDNEENNAIEIMFSDIKGSISVRLFYCKQSKATPDFENEGTNCQIPKQQIANNSILVEKYEEISVISKTKNRHYLIYVVNCSLGQSEVIAVVQNQA